MGIMQPKYYYALVWDSVLDNKDIVIKGQPLVKTSKLPRDPRMLYGTSSNDLRKVKLNRFKKILEYDVLTMKQSVRFVKEIEELALKRDVRIVIWEWADTMSPRYDHYRIISKEHFEELAKDAPGSFGIKKHEMDKESEESIWKATPDPEKNLKSKIKKMLDVDLKFA